MPRLALQRIAQYAGALFGPRREWTRYAGYLAGPHHPTYKLNVRRIYQDVSSALYRPLKASSGHNGGSSIRILELLPGQGQEPVRSRLHIAPLLVVPKYEAISYCWGDPNDKTSVIVNGVDLKVPRRLETALRSMRHRQLPRMLWADAICINQTDDVEKTVQVQLMRQIFANAEKTLIWIGDAQERRQQKISRFALYSIKAGLAHHRRQLKATQGPLISIFEAENKGRTVAPFSSEFYLELIGLLRMPWFQRAWVVQEVAVSSRATIFWGNKQYEWDDVVQALKFMSKVDFPLAFIVTLEHISAIEQERAFYRSGKEKLLSVLSRHQRCEATDTRDKIFSFYGLVENSSAPKTPIHIAYGNDANAEMVFTRTANAILQTDRNLDLLSRAPSTAVPELRLPSWVPDWSCAPASSLTYTWGHGPLSLPGTELSATTTRFSASQNSIHTPTSSHLGIKKLTVSGFSIDEITELGPIYNGIQIPSQVRSLRSIIKEWWKCILSLLRARRVFIAWQKLAYKHPSRSIKHISRKAPYAPTGESMRTAFLSTVSTGEAGTSTSSPALDLELHLFERSAKIGIVGLPYSAWILITHFFSNKPFLVCEIQGRYSLLRRLARTREGRLGLVSAGCEVGDSVVLAEGGSVPLLMRRDGQEEEWELVGDAYLHGVMRGEAWDQRKCRAMVLS